MTDTVPGTQYSYNKALAPPNASRSAQPGVEVVTAYYNDNPTQPVYSGQTFAEFNDPDVAKFLIPTNKFVRPFLANPNGRGGGEAFVFPLGIEGFDLASSATLGIHHFIGDNDVDATIVYPDELHITMDGLFPGKTGMAVANELRRIILASSSVNGKILYLPLVTETLEYVQVISHRITHQADDRTRGVAYSLEFLLVGKGKTLNTPDPSAGESRRPGVKKPNKGTTAHTFVTTQNVRTLRTIAMHVYNNADLWTRVRDKNLRLLYGLEIPAIGFPIAQLPLGMTFIV